MHAHNSIRWELEHIIKAVDSVKSRGTVKTWEVTCLKSAWMSHYTHLHAHHENEDDVFVPYVKTRFHYPEKVRDTLSKDLEMHRHILSLLDCSPAFVALAHSICRSLVVRIVRH